MKITNFIVITFYTLTFLVSGLFLIYISLGVIPLAETLNVIENFYETSKLSTVLTGLVGALLVIISTLFVVHLFGGLIRRKKSLVFSGAGGQITVAIAAIEDVVRRCGDQFLDVKELRPKVAIKGKRLNILANVILYTGVNIPGITERLQSLIKGNLQNVLGIEDDIKVGIHVTKIVEKSKKALMKEEPSRRMELGRET